MAGTNEIRRRISAVEQTRKITSAMEMVSSNRMHRVTSHIHYNRQYFDYIRSAMAEILRSVAKDDLHHPYLEAAKGQRKTFIVISGDKGLCGSYNEAVLRFAYERVKSESDCALVTVGNTAEDFFGRRGRVPDITMLGIVQDPTVKAARRMARQVMELVDSGMTDEVHVIYTSFYGETKNQPTALRVLPIVLDDYELAKKTLDTGEMLYMPSPQLVFDTLVPQYVLGLIFGVMVQAYAGEHFARMNAMHSSTQNAGDMLKNLTTQYNLARQSAITNEIAEITGASEILKNQ
ncbi:MAG: ATP synthase F1 subunit gamma [Oscillospiraceae bacterium]|jgi:F-type H+-transporting ATPase subunit gamma|nr:ATP synthase F1 subunit gamma [Oscillospiraceae bacterium]